MNTVDTLIEQRNAIYLRAENSGVDGAADRCWQMLGVANRHIDRVLSNVLKLTPAVEAEITHCLERASKEFPEMKSGYDPGSATGDSHAEILRSTLDVRR